MIKASIFKMPKESVEWVQPNWDTQLHHALECCDATTEDGEEDPRNIQFPEFEGQHEVKGSKEKIPNIIEPLKTK